MLCLSKTKSHIYISLTGMRKTCNFLKCFINKMVLTSVMLPFQTTRSSERTTARPRSPPLPAHLKNAPSVPPTRTASQRPSRTLAPPTPPPKVEPSRSRAAAKPPPPAPKPVPKTPAKTPPPSRSSRVSLKVFWMI